MRRLATIFLIPCFASALLVFAGGSATAQEEETAREIQQLRKQNEALKEEIEALRSLVGELRHKKPKAPVTSVAHVGDATMEIRTPVRVVVEEVKEAGGEAPKAEARVTRKGTTVVSSARGTKVYTTPGKRGKEGEYVLYENVSASNVRTPYTVYVKSDVLETEKHQLESVTLSHGDAGLETMLRFEKAKVCRKAGMLDKAVAELNKIIDQNLSDVTTHAARLTLVEILQELKKDKEAIAELEKIVSTATDAKSKRDALYGIINLSGDDPKTRIQAIDRLLEMLREKSSEERDEAPEE